MAEKTTMDEVEVAACSADSDDDESDSTTSASKRPRTAFKGAAVYRTKFKKEWTVTWPFIRPVQDDPYSFSCTLCRRQISCKHQGKRDVERHIEKRMHQDNVKATKNQAQLSFSPMSSPLMDKVCCM